MKRDASELRNILERPWAGSREGGTATRRWSDSTVFVVFRGAVPLAVAEREVTRLVSWGEVYVCHCEEVRGKVIVVVVLETYVPPSVSIVPCAGVEKGILRSPPNGSGTNSLEFGADGDGG